MLGELELDGVAEPELVLDSVEVPLVVLEDVAVPEPLAVNELLEVPEGDADELVVKLLLDVEKEDEELVGVADGEPLPDADDAPEGEGGAVLVDEALEEALGELDAEGVEEPEGVALDVAEGEAVFVAEEEDVPLEVLLAVRDTEVVYDAVLLDEDDWEKLGVPELEGVAEPEPDPDPEGVPLVVLDAVAVLELLAESEALGVSEGDEDGLDVEVVVDVGEDEAELVGV